MKVLERYAPEQLEGFHGKSMLLFSLCFTGFIGCCLAAIEFEAARAVFIAAAATFVPLSWALIYFRTSRARCPNCGDPMKKVSRIDVVEEKKTGAGYAYNPWNVLSCMKCRTRVRIPALGPDIDPTLSREEYLILEQDGPGQPDNHPEKF